MPPLRQTAEEHWALQSLHPYERRKYRRSRLRHVDGLRFSSDLKGSVYPGIEASTSEFAISPPRQLRRPSARRDPYLRLSNLECIRLLGAGGNGAVLLGRTKTQPSETPRLGEYFAVKVWRKKVVRESDRLEGKYWHTKDVERSFLGSLPWNPFVAGIVDALDDERNLYLVMECIPHGTLRDQLEKSAPLPLPVTSFYFANIVCGLEFLAEHKICHRDLKPENLLIDGNGYLVIADFGSAVKNDDTSENWTGVGTTIYMAPETFYATKPEIYADWWSLGCILYEMSTGLLPFLGKTDESIHRRMTSGIIRYPAGPRVGETLKDLIKGLLTADPLDRIGRHGALQAMEHPWISRVCWERMRARNYMAPQVPERRNLDYSWQKMPLPEQRQIPGLQIAFIPEPLRFDERFPAKPNF